MLSINLPISAGVNKLNSCHYQATQSEFVAEIVYFEFLQGHKECKNHAPRMSVPVHRSTPPVCVLPLTSHVILSANRLKMYLA